MFPRFLNRCQCNWLRATNKQTFWENAIGHLGAQPRKVPRRRFYIITYVMSLSLYIHIIIDSRRRKPIPIADGTQKNKQNQKLQKNEKMKTLETQKTRKSARRIRRADSIRSSNSTSGFDSLVEFDERNRDNFVV